MPAFSTSVMGLAHGQHYKHKTRSYGKDNFYLEKWGRKIFKGGRKEKGEGKVCTLWSVGSAQLACEHRLVSGGRGQSGSMGPHGQQILRGSLVTALLS